MMTAPCLGAFVGWVEGGEGVEWRTVIVFLVSTYALGLHVFLLNDWADLSERLCPDGGSRLWKLVVSCSFFLVVASSGGLLLGRWWGLSAMAIVICSLIYSHPKIGCRARPVLSTICHLMGGIAHWNIGYAYARQSFFLGLPYALYSALLLSGGHLNHEAMHAQEDGLRGHRTNAVVWGEARASRWSMIAFALAPIVLVVLVYFGRIAPLSWSPLLMAPVIQYLWWRRLPDHANDATNVFRSFRTKYRVLYLGAGMLTALMILLCR